MTGVFRRKATDTVLRLGIGAAFLACLAGAPVQAQGWGFLGGLFGGQPQQSQPPPVSRRHYAPQRRAAPPRSRDAKETETAGALKPPPVDASRFVVVLGDSLGQLLANGLDDAFGDRPDVAVVHKARDSTGLVREDFYDWPVGVTAMLAAAETRAMPGMPPGQNNAAGNDQTGGQDKATLQEKAKVQDRPVSKDRIDVAVMMIGSNDRQSITEGGKTYPSDSEEWTTIYTRRVTAIAEAFRKKNVPLVWVGVPITKSDAFADDMAALNEIYRDVAAKTGAVYVDTWEAFSDDDGNFSAFGPDINGQTVRLRAADGIHFTKAGARKLAHFVETHVRRALDQMKTSTPATAALPAPTDGKAGGVAGQGTPALVKPDAGPVRLLTDAPVAENGRLDAPQALQDATRVAHDDPLVDATLVKGEPQAAHAGRADDAAWPPR